MAPSVTPVILSGGAGTRLWPLSRALRPKQLLPLVTERSMLQETIARVGGLNLAPPIILCNEEHRFMIAEQLRELKVTPKAIALEPEGRNTAPAATVAALLVHAADPDGIVLLLPSDHVITDVPRLHDIVRGAVKAAEAGKLVTFGIPPSAPETGYGYIRRGEAIEGLNGVFAIERFVEKPDLPTANQYLAEGNYVWNSGMFVFRAADFLAELERLKPEMLAACRESIAEARSDLDFLRLGKTGFRKVESISIDYAVMEHTTKGAVILADMGWSDVGSWTALWEISKRDEAGNVAHGDTISLDSRNCYVRSDGNLVATIGVEDLIIVATDDVVLVAAKERAQDVKKIVEKVEKAGRTEHFVHTQVFRPWGSYQNIHEGLRFQVKEIIVHPGERLSQQMHHHRAEHWIVVSGTAEVTRGNETFYLTEDQSTYIPHTTRHCLSNPGKIPLKMIEVQSGPYLGEDDIVRFEDQYGRAPKVTV